jgi:phage terminase large subunit
VDEERVVRIEIPYAPRKIFQAFHDRPQRWGVIVAHRRAGKTVACINELIKCALECAKENPRFAYVAPFYTQAKDVAWTYLRKFTDVIPDARPHESELRVDLPNGGRVRLYGADNYDRLRGGYFDGIVLDEYADMDPRAYSEVIRPALSDRQGWAVFIGTPKGRNSFWDIYDRATKDSDWYTAMLKASITGILPQSELDDARKGMTEDQYAQEYECSFQAAIQGAYYGREMVNAENDKRIGRVPWEPQLKVTTAWDLGIGDATSIWFAQCVGKEVRIIDHVESSGVGLDWYASELQRGARGSYVYNEHILPHDAEVKELGTGRSRVETLQSLGMSNIRVLPNQRVEDGINAGRLLIPKCWFDETKCKRGIEALRQYRTDWDEERKVFSNKPLHDWTSHAADAWRYLALGLQTQPEDAFNKKLPYAKAQGKMRTYA